MPDRDLPKDATLATIRERLANPEDHVCDVMRTMSPCNRKNGNSHVRIGVSGGGRFPNHKVTYFDEAGDEHLFGWFYRDNEQTSEKADGDWSSASMSFQDVQNLLGNIRSLKKRR